MKRFIFTILSVIAVIVTVNAKTITIKKAATTPVIDGKATDACWTAATANKCVAYKPADGSYCNPTEFKMCYDNNNIYILVSVNDATPNMTLEGNTWNSDCVELYFGMDTSYSYVYRPGDCQIRKLCSKTQVNGGIDGSFNTASLINDANFKVIQVDGATYVTEWQIPFATLIETAAFDGKNFRFDLQVGNSVDGSARVGQSFWNSNSDTQWNTILGHGLVVLDAAIQVIEPPVVIPTINNKTLKINRTIVAPTIDGTGNDVAWLTQPTNYITKSIGIVDGFSGNFKMCYDDANLFILVSVTDPTPNEDGSTSWQSDGVHLYFGMDTNSSYDYRPGDWQICKYASKSQAEGGIFYYYGKNIDDPNYKVEQVDDATYTQEWQIPFNALVESANFDSKFFRFEIELNDNNGTGQERTGHIFWNSNADTQWDKIESQGYIQMVNSIVSPALTVDKTTLNVAAAANTSIFNITSNTSWTITSNQNWLTANKTSGTNNSAITLSATANTTTSSRTATVTILGSGLNSKTVTVTQASSSASLSLSLNTLSIDSMASSVNFIITSNVTWTISSNQTWLTLNRTSGSNNALVTITAKANLTNEIRNAIITVSGTGVTSKTITITQAAAASKNRISISKVVNAPIIDGAGTDACWTTVSANKCLAYRPTEMTNCNPSEFKMCYDDDNIYILVTATDLTPNQFSNMGVTWQSDCVELYFGMDTNNAPAYRPGDWQFRKVCAISQENGGIDGSGNIVNMIADPNFKVEQTDGASYVQEWQIPIFTLKETSDFDGRNFRFDMCVSNNVDGTIRVGQSFWNSNADNQYNTVSNQGYVQMGSSTVTPLLTVDKTRLNIAAAANTSTFNISSNISWTLTSNQNWLTANKTSGTNNSAITLSATANTAASARTAIVTISGSGLTSKTVTVTQASASSVLSLSTNILNISAPAGIKTFDIFSSVAWNIITNQTWLTINKTNGNSNSTIIVSATANTDSKVRTAKISVTANGVKTQIITVTQSTSISGGNIILSSNLLNAAKEGDTKVFFYITSDVSWTIICDQTWLKLNKTSGTKNTLITITTDENIDASSRTANVIISCTGGVSDTIKVTQAGIFTSISANTLSNISIYPNPAMNKLTVSLPADTENASVIILNLEGKIVLSGKIDRNSNSINISSLRSGIYTLKLTNSKEIIFKKFVKR